MEEVVKLWTSYAAIAVEAAAGVLIVFAAIEATWRGLKIFFVRPAIPDSAKENVRLRLARWLAVALEFELAADILRTAIAPTWNEIGKLVVIATLRTLLNYFLEQEIQRNTREQARQPDRPTNRPDPVHPNVRT